MYKTCAGFITLLTASTLGDRLVIPLLMVVIGAWLILTGKEER